MSEPLEIYEIHNSAKVGDEFRRLSEIVRPTGKLEVFVAAAKCILAELTQSPAEFGESRDYFPAAGFTTCCAFARPLMVEFAVNEREKVVYIRKFTLV